MEKKKYVYFEDDGYYLGYFEEFPDYVTQGLTLEELKENLLDLHKDLMSGFIPHINSYPGNDLAIPATARTT